jgi:hypothetical protein
VTDGNEQRQNSNIADLIHYIEYNNGVIIQSNIYSVFDYLYKSYAKQREMLLGNKTRISDFDSENLMYHAVIRPILDEDEFKKFDVVCHPSLKSVFCTMPNDLEPEEKRYAQNDWTHIDFLIYDKINKLPVLAIEVDGVTYHKPGSKQARRDELKNAILKKCSLALKRFDTKGGNKLFSSAETRKEERLNYFKDNESIEKKDLREELYEIIYC